MYTVRGGEVAQRHMDVIGKGWKEGMGGDTGARLAV